MESERAKLAFFLGAWRAGQRMAPQVGAKVLSPLFGKIMGQGVGGRMARQVGKEVFNQGTLGAGLGGLLEGGIGAMTAEDGHKGEAFARGALHGAAVGGLGGAASGVITPFSRAARTKALLAAGATPGQAAHTIRRSWGRNVLDAARGTGPGGRIPSAIEAATAPVEMLGIGYLADKVTPSSGGAAPAAQQPPQQPPPGYEPGYPHPGYPQGQIRTAAVAPSNGPRNDEGRALDPLYVTPFSSALGAGLADEALAKYAPKMNPGSFTRKRGLPALGAAALTIPSVLAIRAAQPARDPLAEIDVDALKYYFGKQPPPANP